MRKVVLIFALLIAPAFALTTGCVYKTEKVEKPVATQPPPLPPRVEEPPPRPYEPSSWVPGHWDWNGHEYVWTPGHWE